MNKFFHCILLLLLSNYLVAQDGLVVVGGGISNGPSPAAVFAKKVDIVYEFLPTNFLASLNIYHSDIKADANINKAELFMNYSLHDLDSPKLIIALGLDGREFKYADITTRSSYMCIYSLRYKLPSVKVYAFAKSTIQYNTTVPIAMIVDKKATIPDDLLTRLLSCTNIASISKKDLDILKELTTVCRIFSYIIYKK